MTRLASLDDIPPGLVEILDYIRRHGPVRAVRSPRRSGSAGRVITQRLAALAAYGLIAEDGVGPSTGGRAPRRLRFCADAGYLLVADLGATSIDVAVADLQARSWRTGQSLPTSLPAPTWC